MKKIMIDKKYLIFHKIFDIIYIEIDKNTTNYSTNRKIKVFVKSFFWKESVEGCICYGSIKIQL